MEIQGNFLGDLYVKESELLKDESFKEMLDAVEEIENSI